jgi:hypothetical protein
MVMSLADVTSIWIAALFTIWAFTFIFRDNAFFKFAEHVYVGAAAGNGIVYGVDNVTRYGVAPFMKGSAYYIVLFILGLVLYARYHKTYFWLSRIPIALMVGIGMGLSMRSTVTSEFIAQIQSTATMKIFGVDAFTAFNNLLFIILLVCTIYYFVFTFPGMHAGGKGYISKIARYGMMAAFGYTFANGFLSRVTMIFGRFDFLKSQWLPLPGAMVALPILLILAIYAMLPAEKRPWPKATPAK